jgi:hypothetical protein
VVEDARHKRADVNVNVPVKPLDYSAPSGH